LVRLLDHHAARLLEFPVSRGRTHENTLPHQGFPLLEAEGTVVQGRRKAETVLDQGLLPRPIALEHPTDLGEGHVGLIHDQEEVLGEVVEQARGPLAFPAAIHVARIVLDTGAGADLQHHLHVEVGSRLDPLGLEEEPVVLKPLHTPLQLLANEGDGLLDGPAGSGVVGGGIDGGLLQRREHLACEGIKPGDPLDLIAP
jgi:hypothetical protein